MIYASNPIDDYNNILQYINEYTKAFGVNIVQIDTAALIKVCFEIRNAFPHVDGIESASVFKKAAYFVAHFIKAKPIRAEIMAVGGAAKSDINAVISFDIALAILQNSKILQSDGGTKSVDQPIYISDHSYTDIIEALSSEHFCPTYHYQLLAVLFEQLVYKTNRHCEYLPKPERGYYPTVHSVTGDSMHGA